MNTTPKIIIKDGYEPSQNGTLNSITTPATVDTIQAPADVITYANTIQYIPSTRAALTSFTAPNVTGLSYVYYENGAGLFNGYTNLRTISFRNITSLSDVLGGGYNTCGIFARCYRLETIDMPNLESIFDDFPTSGYAQTGTFQLCQSLQSIYFPKLQSISGRSVNGTTSGAFNQCTSLQTVNLPCVHTITDYHFGRCSGLKSVTLGSVGHPVQSLGSNTFYYDTQGGLTITVYTTDGASLARQPWGATNATIIYEEA